MKSNDYLLELEWNTLKLCLMLKYGRRLGMGETSSLHVSQMSTISSLNPVKWLFWGLRRVLRKCIEKEFLPESSAKIIGTLCQYVECVFSLYLHIFEWFFRQTINRNQSCLCRVCTPQNVFTHHKLSRCLLLCIYINIVCNSSACDCKSTHHKLSMCLQLCIYIIIVSNCSKWF